MDPTRERELQQLERIYRINTHLHALLDGGDELRLLEYIVKRITIGRAQYGRLNVTTNIKDWRQETAEEMLDAIAYIAMQVLRDAR